MLTYKDFDFENAYLVLSSLHNCYSNKWELKTFNQENWLYGLPMELARSVVNWLSRGRLCQEKVFSFGFMPDVYSAAPDMCISGWVTVDKFVSFVLTSEGKVVDVSDINYKEGELEEAAFSLLEPLTRE